MEHALSGVYLNMAVPNKGLLAKMIVDGSEFLEVATLGTTVFLSFGSCQE